MLRVKLDGFPQASPDFSTKLVIVTGTFLTSPSI
jgi:hypothetical protein